MPGVSTNTICASGRVTTPWIDVRVVCGLSATMATFCPTRAFSSVDFPALGRPTSDTKPDLNLFMSYRLRFAEAYFLHAEFVAGQDFDTNAVAIGCLSGLGHVAQPFADQPADRAGFDVVLAVERLEEAADAVQFEAARHDVTALP